MPWWGWLIAGCVALIVVAWVTIGVIGTRTARRLFEQDQKRHDEFFRRPFGQRW